MEFVPLRKAVVLQEHLNLVVHLVVDILAAYTSDQSHDAEGHGDHGHNTTRRISWEM